MKRDHHRLSRTHERPPPSITDGHFHLPRTTTPACHDTDRDHPPLVTHINKSAQSAHQQTRAICTSTNQRNLHINSSAQPAHHPRPLGTNHDHLSRTSTTPHGSRALLTEHDHTSPITTAVNDHDHPLPVTAPSPGMDTDTEHIHHNLPST